MSSSDEDCHPLPPAKRRRISRKPARAVLATDEEGSDCMPIEPPPKKPQKKSTSKNAPSTSRTATRRLSSASVSAATSHASAKPAKATKPKAREEKKPKHRMITYSHGVEDHEDLIATQFDSRIPSSPSQIRGARYIKDAPAAPPLRPPAPVPAPAPTPRAVQHKPSTPADFVSPEMPVFTQVPDHTGVGIMPDRGGAAASHKPDVLDLDDSDEEAFVTLSAAQSRTKDRRPLQTSTSTLNVEPKLSQQMRALKPPPSLSTEGLDDIVSEPDEIQPSRGRDTVQPALVSRISAGSTKLDLDDDLLDDWSDDIDDEILNITTGPTKTKPVAAKPVESKPANTAVVTDDFADFDLEKELADLPSNAFDSSSPVAQRVQAPPLIELSSSPVQQAAQALVAPSRNLQQRTLFGGVAVMDSQQGPQPTQGRQRNFIRDLPPEKPTHHKLNLDTLDTYIYPTNLGPPRGYQFGIVSACLFANTLVALPTGLGKTFIAATVMLNWLRWTRDAQIVFVAPTKPLVAQQVEACIGIAGIPHSQTAFMTGSMSGGSSQREEDWRTKRVFFCTPQIYQNDLKAGLADPKRLVLLVVDEAHRASGKYSYTQIVQHVRRFNDSYRILALTATPGGSVKAVQDVIDQLDLARIEIRTEESIDIKEHTFKKELRIETFQHSEDMLHIEELLRQALAPIMSKLKVQNAYWSSDPMTLTNYGILKSRQACNESNTGKSADHGAQMMLKAIFDVLGRIATAIELFKFYGLGPFYHAMKEWAATVKSGKNARSITDHSAFQSMMSKLQLWTSNSNFVGHPKLERLQDIVQNHFLDAGQGLGEHVDSSATRIMIFTKYRPSAEDICQTLKRTGDMIKPHVFVGQAQAKESKGMDQKTQLAVIEDFKAGKYNVLIATSVGEEGLDIGEIDLIICYDASASPIRMLQRMGRTGRKRSGRVYLLMMKGKEEQSYYTAVDSYQRMQKEISNGNNFAYHEDRNRRIIPREIRPQVEYREVEIPEENKGVDFMAPKKRKQSAKRSKRPAKTFDMPQGAITGFMQASRIGNDKPQANERKRASVNLVGVPPTEEVLLNAIDEKRLHEQYQSVPDHPVQNAEIGVPNVETCWQDQSTLRPTVRVAHGTASRRFASAMSRMHACRHAHDRANTPEWDMNSSMSIGLLSQNALPKRRAAAKPRKPKAAAETAATAAPKAKAKPTPKPKAQAASTDRAAAHAPAPMQPPARPKAKPAPKPAQTPKTRPTKPATSRYIMTDDMDDGGAEEGASSSPPRTDPRLALPTQGEWLGSDTSGDDAEDEEPDSELRAFVVEAGDEEDEELPSSIPLSSQRVRALQREVLGTRRRLVRAGPTDLFDSDSDGDDGRGGDGEGGGGQPLNARSRAVVIDTSSP